MEMFLRTQKIFESLSQMGSSSNRDLFTSRLSELSPILRYCEYNLKKHEGKNAETLLNLMTASGETSPGLSSSDATSESLNARLSELLRRDHMQNSEEMRVVNVRGRFVTVEEESLRLSLLACRDAESALLRQDPRDEERSLAAFASLFDAYDACLRQLASERDRVSKSGASRGGDLALLFAWTKFGKQRRSVERNVLLLRSFQSATTRNVQNGIALYGRRGGET